MHNLNYLLLAYETLPQEIYDSSECNNIEIMYKKAIMLGDSIKCFYSYLRIVFTTEVAYGNHRKNH